MPPRRIASGLQTSACGMTRTLFRPGNGAEVRKKDCTEVAIVVLAAPGTSGAAISAIVDHGLCSELR